MTEESVQLPGAPLQPNNQQKQKLAALRHPFEGVFNVFAFNWPKYILAGILSYVLIVLWMVQVNPVLKPLFLAAAAILFVWTIVSLLVSCLVYDLSGLYKYDWLLKSIKTPPAAILNLNAGFDEVSEALLLMFPDSQLKVFDFYSPTSSTEPSIELARAANASQAAAMEPVSVALSGWQLDDDSQDLVLLFLSAHEVRKPAEREELFGEILRVLKSNGQFILVEHMRDAANFLAYGPGSMHFYPRSEWLRLANKCGYKVQEERLVTPFVRVFYLCKT